MRRKGFVITALFIVICMFMSIPSVFAWGEDKKAETPAQAQAPSQGAVLPGGVKAYEGEISDEMIGSFLRADAKIRALRAQISQITQKILEEEKVEANVYMTIAQKLRDDQVFLEKVKAKAAMMAEANAAAAQAEANAAATAAEGTADAQ